MTHFYLVLFLSIYSFILFLIQCLFCCCIIVNLSCFYVECRSFFYYSIIISPLKHRSSLICSLIPFLMDFTGLTNYMLKGLCIYHRRGSARADKKSRRARDQVSQLERVLCIIRHHFCRTMRFSVIWFHFLKFAFDF